MADLKQKKLKTEPPISLLLNKLNEKDRIEARQSPDRAYSPRIGNYAGGPHWSVAPLSQWYGIHFRLNLTLIEWTTKKKWKSCKKDNKPCALQAESTQTVARTSCANVWIARYPFAKDGCMSIGVIFFFDEGVTNCWAMESKKQVPSAAAFPFVSLCFCI